MADKRVRFEIVQDWKPPSEPIPVDDDPENCAENGLCDWERVGFNPDWGQIYECRRCGGRTP